MRARCALLRHTTVRTRLCSCVVSPHRMAAPFSTSSASSPSVSPPSSSSFPCPSHSSPYSTGSSLEGKPKLLVITGPTGIGKSRLAIQLAQQLNGEVVSADSVQLYRQLSIGSNKMPPSSRGGIPHHLIDCADLPQDLTVADWHRQAKLVIRDILARGKLPVVTGGTMLYLRWLLYGQPLEVGTDAKTRRRADDFIGDPTPWDTKVAALGLTPQSLTYLSEVRARGCQQRLSRALEILFLSSGPPPVVSVPTLEELPEKMEWDARCVLVTGDRTWLTRQLDYRCEEMIEQGLLEETFDLLRTGTLQASTQMLAIGYRQASAFLALPNPTAADFRSMLSALQVATRQYVRRQLAFFRTEAAYRFVTVPTPDVPILPPIPHPLTLQLPSSVFDQLGAEVRRLVQLSPSEYWTELCSGEAVRREQEEARAASKELPNAPARRLYQTQLFIYDNAGRVEEALERLRRMRAEAEGEVEREDDVKEEEKKMGDRAEAEEDVKRKAMLASGDG